MRLSNFSAIARPNPVPPYNLVVEESSCVKASNILFKFDSLIPIPVSNIENRTIGFSSVSITSIPNCIEPLDVNLIAQQVQ
jgi:hypothetical protein